VQQNGPHAAERDVLLQLVHERRSSRGVVSGSVSR
jgi:hypothetical protein